LEKLLPDCHELPGPLKEEFWKFREMRENPKWAVVAARGGKNKRGKRGPRSENQTRTTGGGESWGYRPQGGNIGGGETRGLKKRGGGMGNGQRGGNPVSGPRHKIRGTSSRQKHRRRYIKKNQVWKLLLNENCFAKDRGSRRLKNEKWGKVTQVPWGLTNCEGLL